MPPPLINHLALRLRQIIQTRMMRLAEIKSLRTISLMDEKVPSNKDVAK